MKNSKKLLTVSLAALLAGVALASCGNSGSNPDSDLVDMDYVLAAPGTLAAGYTSLANTHANGAIDANGKYTAGGIKFQTKETIRTVYQTEPNKDLFNYLCNTWTYNSEHYTNMVDGLVENDKYGAIVGALALGYKVSVDEATGKETWSFQLRENAEWVDNKTGKKVAEVTAADFVSSAKYVLDPANGSGTAGIVQSFVDGAAQYYKEKAAYEAYVADPSSIEEGQPAPTDPSFDMVGIKAVSKFVIEYTLPENTPYFLSALTYSPFLPVYGEYLESQGTDFGATVNNILVNGAFRITEHTFETRMIYGKNYHYYDRDHVYVKHVIKQFYASTLTLDTARRWYEAGTIDSFSVNVNDEDGWNQYVLGPDQSGSLKNPYDNQCNAVQSYGDATYIGYFNFNRTFYEFANPADVTSDAQRSNTAAALLNKNFRLGFLRGLNVQKYLARYGDENAINWLMRGYTNKELTAADGKDYTDYVNNVFNEKEGTEGVSLIGIDNGSDPCYSESKAQSYFEAAYAELKDSVSFPINVDYLGSMNTTIQAFENNMLNDLVANATITVGGQKIALVHITYNVPRSSDENTKWGSMYSNFDFSMWSGWGPDYADPNTYLHTMAIFGDMVEYLGLPTTEEELDTLELSQYLPAKYQALKQGENAHDALIALQNDILGRYNELYLEGAAITDPTRTAERYQKFAEAEYALIYEEGIIIPWLSQNGYSASVSKTVPWQAGRASYGLTSDKFKNVVITTAAMTKEQRAAVTAEYEAGKNA